MTMIRWIPVLLLVTDCGGSSPTAPSPQPAPIPAPAPAPAPPQPPPLNLSGEWGGVFAFSIDGQPFSRGVVVNILQDGTHVVGNYSAGANGQQGAVDLTLSSMDRDATITGTIGVRGTSTDPNVRCTGTGRVTGTASPFTIRSLVVPLDNCDGAMTAISLTMTR